MSIYEDAAELLGDMLRVVASGDVEVEVAGSGIRKLLKNKRVLRSLVLEEQEANFLDYWYGIKPTFTIGENRYYSKEQ